MSKVTTIECSAIDALQAYHWAIDMFGSPKTSRLMIYTKEDVAHGARWGCEFEWFYFGNSDDATLFLLRWGGVATQ